MLHKMARKVIASFLKANSDKLDGELPQIITGFDSPTGTGLVVFSHGVRSKIYGFRI